MSDAPNFLYNQFVIHRITSLPIAAESHILTHRRLCFNTCMKKDIF
jgi:hypothetical protein